MACYGTVLGYNFERAALATPSMSVMCVCTHTHAHVCNWVRSEGYAGALQVRCRCAAVAFMMPTATTVDATACCASCAGGTAIPDSLVNVCALEVQYIWHLQREKHQN